jgi:glutaredoxin
MTAVALYWAQGCHLCEPAKATARAVCAELGVPLDEIDVTGDDALEATYREALPVLEIDGRRAFKFFVDEHDLRERLARSRAR